MDFAEQRVCESIPECLLVVDRHGDIVCTNAEMERLFGFRPHEVVGGPIAFLLAEDERQAYARQLQNFVASGSPTPRRFEVYGLHKYGRELPIEIRMGLLRKAHEVFVVHSVRDLSDHGIAREQLQQSRKTNLIAALA
jgi:PAS domain S-box-containing protein